MQSITIVTIRVNTVCKFVYLKVDEHISMEYKVFYFLVILYKFSAIYKACQLHMTLMQNDICDLVWVSHI